MQPMNDMERHLVGKIREMRGTKGMECRICLEDNEEESKLIVPCKCTGSVEATHEHCLKEWIKRRVEQYPKKRASCEVCNTEFNYTLANRRTFDCN
jgi:E3 ubiquitin-protein ligase DOA10